MNRPSTAAVHRPRAGLSLLEVLVACGILVIGLTSIAAILPAAGSRLGQATQADRGGVLAANAYAEVVSRGLIAADVFSVPGKACVFGKELSELPTVGTAGTVTAVSSGTLAQRIDTANGFLLADDLVYTTGTTSDLPVNAFAPAAGSIRRFNEGLCWGGMIACTGNAQMGTPATLSIAVFKKEGGPPKEIALTGSSGMFRMTTPSESDLKTYLPGCGSVLALPASAGAPPRWFRINSAWKQENGTACWVSFADNAGLASFAGANPTVYGFEQLLRVDQYPVTLE
jgi:hypothetical protein